jgi:hypothetical protein
MIDRKAVGCLTVHLGVAVRLTSIWLVCGAKRIVTPLLRVNGNEIFQ